MDIKIFDPKKAEPYIPQWSGERASAKIVAGYKPVTFHLRSMTFGEQEEWDNRLQISVDPVTMNHKTNAVALNHEIFANFVARIENFSIGGDPVVTPGVFLDVVKNSDKDKGIDAGLHGLVDEIVSAIRSRAALERGMAKNLLPSSDSSLTKKKDEGLEAAEVIEKETPKDA